MPPIPVKYVDTGHVQLAVTESLLAPGIGRSTPDIQ